VGVASAVLAVPPHPAKASAAIPHVPMSAILTIDFFIACLRKLSWTEKVAELTNLHRYRNSHVIEFSIARITGRSFAVIPTMMNPDRNKKTAFVAVLSFFWGMGATTFVVDRQLFEQGAQRGTTLNRNWR
jgi:hypothetical protein